MRLDDPELFLEACWVDGRPFRAAGGERIAVLNPATGVTLGRVPAFAEGEVEEAIASAAAAFPAWRARTAPSCSAAAPPRAPRQLLRAHRARRGDARDALRARGDVRPGGAAVPRHAGIDEYVEP
jgi:acyl-CoA reductase-like NAD-dependent aldehyde dehydrogenase